MGQPFVSIIMPVLNESRYIQRSLSAALGQVYPKDKYEILVVDGMSDDDTREIVFRIINSLTSSKIRLLDNRHRYFSSGFNIGLRESVGEVIVMLGGHVEIEPYYVQKCVSLLERYSVVDCVGGNLETIGEDFVSKAIALAVSSLFGVGGVAFRTQSKIMMEVDTVAFGAYRRLVFVHMGSLDEEMVKNQDDEFNYRLLEMGGKILLDPAISARYYSRSGITSLSKQYFRYGVWKIRVFQKHPGQIRFRHLMPFLFISALLMSIALLPISDLYYRIFLFIFCLYLMANIVSSLWLAYKDGWKYFLVLPVIFAALHFSYGLGFLIGLIKFSRFWGEGREDAADRRKNDARE